MQTKVSYGKPGQDKARVRESRYVIKVMSMRDKNKNKGDEDEVPLVCANQRMYG